MTDRISRHSNCRVGRQRLAVPRGDLTVLANRGVAGIDEQRSMGTAKPGEFGPPKAPTPAVPEHGTSHISIVDAQPSRNRQNGRSKT